MRSPRQTHLGLTTTKALTIVDLKLPNTASYVPTGEASIFWLPDELLLSIVELVAYGPGSESRVKVLSRVCHRLRRIAQPLLFRAIKFKYPDTIVPPTINVCKLHRTLRENVELRQHCRSLRIYIPDSSRKKVGDNYLVARDFADWLTRMRCLSIHGGFAGNGRDGNTRTWALISQIVAKCEDIEHVEISREFSCLYLGSIFKWLNFPNMKKLDISGISKWKYGNVELELEKHRTAPFTSLRISDYEERPESTSLLIQWPAALTHFEFNSLYNNFHIMDYPMFESWLLIHKETLKHIDIGYLSHRGSNRLFNATLFPNLEFLQLSRWQMDIPLEFEVEDANVLGPKLKTFGWDFTIYDQHSESWSDFGEPAASWIHELVEVAIARKAALKTIKIQFSPVHWDTNEEMGYPWDRMDNVRDKLLRPNGMDLVYNGPIISKEGWLEHLRVEREYVNDVAENEQPVSADEAEEGEETEEVAEPETQTGYHGEDIRGYLVSRPRA